MIKVFRMFFIFIMFVFVSTASYAEQQSWLAVLSASDGVITKSSKNEYCLIVHNMENDTVLFTSRPDRETKLISSREFIANFDKIFSGSMPNAALVHNKDEEALKGKNGNKPVIVTLNQVKSVDENTTKFIITTEAENPKLTLGKIYGVKLFIDNISSIPLCPGGMYNNNCL
ncbi:hypothetical protein [uncultured Shewanella sp.]|uniref:hypothetical protein n=1 Tax=uncultured Shewanella sp. TaxID=173975 RepID=UPI00261A1300|nr:hypothetical protein [uncultured Shewanella sp.]